MANGSRERSVTLDDLIALNDEIAALARSGMPLERGLAGMGNDLPGRLGEIVKALGTRMEGGETLTEALASSGSGVPRLYRSVVEAGIRSGRLAVALEGLANYARAFAEARRSVSLALAYPLLVLTLAYGLFVLLVVLVFPRFLAAFDTLGLPVHAALRALGAMGRTAQYWGPVLPALLVAMVVVWFGTRQAAGLGGGRAYGVLRWAPWLGSMMRSYEAAGFADLLALLVEHGVPYPDALRLAGEASGDSKLALASAALAGQVARGDGTGPAASAESWSPFPPMLRWVLESAPSQGDLVLALRQMAARYRGLAHFQSEKLRVLLPTLLLFGIGVSSCLVYAVALFLPLTTLWDSLASQAP